MSARLFAIGGAHIDRRGRIAGPYVAEASNPGIMREEVGGGAFNAARIAAQRGLSVAFMSLRGGDLAGQRVAEAIEQSGMEDYSAIFLDRATPSYTAILTEEGNLVAALADMGLYEIGFARQIRRRRIRDGLASADAVLCDANLPVDALVLLAECAADKPIFAIGTSPAKVERLAPILDRLSCLFMNRREASRLARLQDEISAPRLARELAALGLRSGLISAGSAPLLCMQAESLHEIEPPSPVRLADVTGAGDALAGAGVAALIQGLALVEAAREGLAVAKLVVESDKAAPEIADTDFRMALAGVSSARALEQEKT